MAREYKIRPLVCDCALDIPMGDTTFVLYFNSRNNAELVKAVLEWEDAHPNEAIPYQPTLTPSKRNVESGGVMKITPNPCLGHGCYDPDLERDCGHF